MNRLLATAAIAGASAGCVMTDLSAIDCVGFEDDYRGVPTLFELLDNEDARAGDLISEAGELRFVSERPREATAGCDCDADGDGLDDGWERSALENLKPGLQLHDDEPALCDRDADVALVGRVTPVGDRIRALIAIVYTADYGRCGAVAHRGDVERVALDLEPVAGSSDAIVRSVYTAAHEYTSLDGSQVHDASVIAKSAAGNPRWIAYVSSGKHATYVSPADCRSQSDLPCAREACPDDNYLHVSYPPITNAGEPDAGKADTLAIGRSEVEIWSDAIYCPDISLDAGCGSSSVAEKLLRDPFVDGQPMIE